MTLHGSAGQKAAVSPSRTSLIEKKKNHNVFFRFALEPLLPKKMHSRSQDKLDKDDPDKEKKDKKKEKRNSKHQEIFDKEFKPTDIPLQQSEAVILSETVISQGALSSCRRGPVFAPHFAEGAVHQIAPNGL